MWKQLLNDINNGEFKALARSISLVENEAKGFDEFMQALQHNHPTTILGITGPPGSGKSTLTDALIAELIKNNKKVGVLCVDPSSPFNLGAVLGDRIRMSEWYTHPNVFIRSLATRGSLGGLNPKTIEITDILKEASFDYVIVETVGVGQSEVDIAALADTTIVVLVPESGDEVQTMKSGLMEIADIFVVNKCDRPGADLFVKNLRLLLAPAFKTHPEGVEIVKTIASQKQGINELFSAINQHQRHISVDDKKYWLLAERAYHLIQAKRMKEVSKQELKQMIENLKSQNKFNLYKFVSDFPTSASRLPTPDS